MTAKVGIYSGTFDPVHNGHVTFAKEAIEKCGLDKVFLLVEPRPRRKQGVKALEHRQNMVHLAIQKEPQLGSIVLGHARFTVAETLPALHSRFKGSRIYFLMGDDTLTHFTDAHWPQIDEFIQATHLIIGVRGRSIEDVKQQIGLIEKTRGIKIKYQTFSTSMSELSSTKVRSELRKGKQPPELSRVVYNYIKAEGLYAAGFDS